MAVRPSCGTSSSPESNSRTSFRGGDGWLLEVVDEYRNSTVWDDSFGTEQAALDEVLKTAEKEGMDSRTGVHRAADIQQGLFPPVRSIELPTSAL